MTDDEIAAEMLWAYQRERPDGVWDSALGMKAALAVARREIERNMYVAMQKPPARVLLAACPTLKDGEAVKAAQTWSLMLDAFAKEHDISLNEPTKTEERG